MTLSLSNGRPPRLPQELLEQCVQALALPCTYGDPVAAQTLAACSLVSRAFRQTALTARYGVMVAPRHVRDFRKWYKRSQAEMTGYAHALFVALDDVSKLTSMSAGWDAELIRLLQQQGPHLTHLSMLSIETRAVLRDPAQIRGPRIRSFDRTNQQSQDDMIALTSKLVLDNAKRRRNVARMLRRMKQGRLIQGDALSAVPLKSSFENRNEAQTRAEMAAAKERARQTLPRWLRDELAAASAAAQSSTQSRTVDEAQTAREIKRRYKAHFATDAREYQHEHSAADEARSQMKMTSDERAALNALTSSVTLHNSASQQQQQQQQQDESEDEEEDDVDIDWACMPVRLSLCPSLPLHEHEEPLNFARMSIWTRVQEMDVFVAVPSEVPRCLELLSSLVGSPLTKFRFSSINATLLITIPPSLTAKVELSAVTSSEQSNADERKIRLLQPSVNIAAGLQAVLQSETLRSLLLSEFSNHRVPDVQMLERAMQDAILCSPDSSDLAAGRLARERETKSGLDVGGRGDAKHCSSRRSMTVRASLASTLHALHHRTTTSANGNDQVRVRILQGNQGHFGKLKERRREFLQHALGIEDDCWTQNGL